MNKIHKLCALLTYLNYAHATRHHALIEQEVLDLLASDIDQKQAMKNLIAHGNLDFIQALLVNNPHYTLHHFNDNGWNDFSPKNTAPENRVRMVEFLAGHYAPEEFVFGRGTGALNLGHKFWSGRDWSGFQRFQDLTSHQDNVVNAINHVIMNDIVKHSIDLDEEVLAFCLHYIPYIVSREWEALLLARFVGSQNSHMVGLMLKMGADARSLQHLKTEPNSWVSRMLRTLSTNHGRMRMAGLLPQATDMFSMSHKDLIAILGGPKAPKFVKLSSAQKRALLLKESQ